MIRILDYCIKYGDILYIKYHETLHELYIYIKGKNDRIIIHNVNRDTYNEVWDALKQFQGD